MKASEWDRLVSAACDGNATDEQIEQLDRMLRENPGLRDHYLFYVDTHASLVEDCAAPEVALATPGPVAWNGLTRVVATVALLGLAGSAWFAWRSAPPTANPFLAVVTNADGALWEGQDASVMIGSALGPGPVELCEGRVEFQLDSGVRVALEGPARFDLVTDHLGILHEGRLSARVPPEGIGFTVETPGMQVVDLGTEFGLNVDASGVSDIHVFHGEVEAVTGQGKRKQLLTSQATRRARPRARQLEEVAFDPGRFASPPEVVDGVDRVWGRVRALRNPPETVRRGTYQHNYLLLFQEQSHVELEDPLEVSVTEPGRHSVAFKKPGAAKGFRQQLMVGERVDSFFLHYDTKPESSTRVRGTVRFERPIVAVIAGAKQLAATDDLLGSWCTRYDKPSTKSRQLENDKVTISGDRRTLTLDWSVGPSADQIRILVAAEDSVRLTQNE